MPDIAVPPFLLAVEYPDGTAVPNMYVAPAIGQLMRLDPTQLAAIAADPPTWAQPDSNATQAPTFQKYTVAVTETRTSRPPQAGWWIATRMPATVGTNTSSVRLYMHDEWRSVSESLVNLALGESRSGFFRRSVNADQSIYDTGSFRWAPLPGSFARLVAEWCVDNGWPNLVPPGYEHVTSPLVGDLDS